MKYSNEPMLEMYIFETSQLLEQLEKVIIASEEENNYSQEAINEIFRLMHTIKGSSAMMLFNNISTLAHSIEDLFYFLREEKPKDINTSMLSDLSLECVDFIKVEIEKLKNNDPVDGNPSKLMENNNDFLNTLKNASSCTELIKRPTSNKKQQYYISSNKNNEQLSLNMYRALIFFKEGCEMENIRSFTIIHNLIERVEEAYYIPEDISDNDESSEWIRKNGFEIFIKTRLSYEELYNFFMETIFLKSIELTQLKDDTLFQRFYEPKKVTIENNDIKEKKYVKDSETSNNHGFINVSVEKLDKLMDLVGEMVIAEAMVTQNPELEELELESFYKAARQLHKITTDIQDMVMSIRMVPISTTFLKMQRITRDMCKKLGKEIKLELIGEETEVDKNIIEHISDPLMHLIRNAIDHGIEDSKERLEKGKDKHGKVTLEAKNSGSDVLITIKDDGKGLNKNKIYNKAIKNGLINKQESEMTKKEIYNLILLPGFTTKENVTEFSGRGVGMDVVAKSLEMIGGSISVDSLENEGTIITLKLPLTLAIIEGMNIKTGDSCFTIPITSIKESFRPNDNNCFKDTNENEMIMVRGNCYPIIRLHEYFKINTNITNISDGILIIVEQDDKIICLFADELLGQQQIVVKALPRYIKNIKNIKGLAGCTLLGDGSISLILDIANI